MPLRRHGTVTSAGALYDPGYRLWRFRDDKGEQMHRFAARTAHGMTTTAAEAINRILDGGSELFNRTWNRWKRKAPELAFLGRDGKA